MSSNNNQTPDDFVFSAAAPSRHDETGAVRFDDIDDSNNVDSDQDSDGDEPSGDDDPQADEGGSLAQETNGLNTGEIEEATASTEEDSPDPSQQGLPPVLQELPVLPAEDEALATHPGFGSFDILLSTHPEAFTPQVIAKIRGYFTVNLHSALNGAGRPRPDTHFARGLEDAFLRWSQQQRLEFFDQLVRDYDSVITEYHRLRTQPAVQNEGTGVLSVSSVEEESTPGLDRAGNLPANKTQEELLAAAARNLPSAEDSDGFFTELPDSDPVEKTEAADGVDNAEADEAEAEEDEAYQWPNYDPGNGEKHCTNCAHDRPLINFEPFVDEPLHVLQRGTCTVCRRRQSKRIRFPLGSKEGAAFLRDPTNSHLFPRRQYRIPDPPEAGWYHQDQTIIYPDGNRVGQQRDEDQEIAQNENVILESRLRKRKAPAEAPVDEETDSMDDDKESENESEDAEPRRRKPTYDSEDSGSEYGGSESGSEDDDSDTDGDNNASGKSGKTPTKKNGNGKRGRKNTSSDKGRAPKRAKH